MQKQPLRKEIKSKLKQISDEKIKLYSDNVFLKLAKKVDDFQVRFVYFSTEKEIQTDKIIKLLMQKGKTIVVPKIIENNEMTVIEYKSDSGLSPGKYGILEIDNGQEFTEKIDIAIIPGMAFTTDGKRLGRGKGYYDKFLGKNKKAYKIGICMPEQIIENIPVEKHDVIMDEIIY